MILENFSRIAAVPRESGHEEKIREFITSWASEHGIRYVVDAAGNVVLYKDPTPGHENTPAVALQGHMDMVCVKRPGSGHDFRTDPIEIVRDGDIIRAKDTSLGADNGIALALMMDLFTDSGFVHGPLEGICTVNEEVGLSGAKGLDPSLIHARMLINLDSEEEGVIYIGCAGGSDVKGVFRAEKKPCCEKWTGLRLSVGGLKSGHSGGKIHLQRANAIKVVARMLHQAGKQAEYRLASFDGGSKHNAIPAQAEAVFAVKKENADAFRACLEAYAGAMLAENRVEEPGMTIEVTLASVCSAYCPEDSKKFVNSLFMAPHGVLAWSKSLPGIVQTSCNLAIVRTEGDEIHLLTSQRSSVESQRDAASERMAMILATSGAKMEIGNGYPAWTPDPDSALARICADVWKRTTGREATVTAIHAGLECGIINSRVPGMDSVSIGPDMKNVHTVDECLNLKSAERIGRYVRDILGEIAK